MLKTIGTALLVSAAITAPGATFAQQPPVADLQAQCGRLQEQAAELKSQRNGAMGRRVGGFLAGIASRAMVYAPSPDLGSSVLGRVTGQALESEAHERVGSGLHQAEQRGRAADAGAASERLRAIEAEAKRLNCPVA